MKDSNILLSFKGEMTSDLLASVLQIMETKMNYLHEKSKVQKRVYNILVESLQNLYHHIDRSPQASSEEKTVFFVVKREEDRYSIMTGNYIRKEEVTSLEKRINEVNALSIDELKVLYKKILNNGKMSDKGGGGLGMIDIARKSKQKLEYRFFPSDDIYSFYTLNVNVEKL